MTWQQQATEIAQRRVQYSGNRIVNWLAIAVAIALLWIFDTGKKVAVWAKGNWPLLIIILLATAVILALPWILVALGAIGTAVSFAWAALRYGPITIVVLLMWWRSLKAWENGQLPRSLAWFILGGLVGLWAMGRLGPLPTERTAWISLETIFLAFLAIGTLFFLTSLLPEWGKRVALAIIVLAVLIPSAVTLFNWAWKQGVESTPVIQPVERVAPPPVPAPPPPLVVKVEGCGTCFDPPVSYNESWRRLDAKVRKRAERSASKPIEPQEAEQP